MNFKFKKNERLRKHNDFKNVFKNGRKIVSKHLIIYYIKNNLPFSRVGISIKKKVGKAYKRNRIRRLLKEFFRLNKNRFKNSYDFLFVVRFRYDLINLNLLSEHLNALFKNKIFIAEGC